MPVVDSDQDLAWWETTPENIDAFRRTESDILRVDAHVLYKDKADGRVTWRIAAKENFLPSQPSELNVRDVCNDDHKKFPLAMHDAGACAGDWSQAKHQLL